MSDVIDAKAAIAWNANDKKKHQAAIEESLRTGKPVRYQVGDFTYEVSAEYNNG